MSRAVAASGKSKKKQGPAGGTRVCGSAAGAVLVLALALPFAVGWFWPSAVLRIGAAAAERGFGGRDRLEAGLYLFGPPVMAFVLAGAAALGRVSVLPRNAVLRWGGALCWALAWCALHGALVVHAASR